MGDKKGCLFGCGRGAANSRGRLRPGAGWMGTIVLRPRARISGRTCLSCRKIALVSEGGGVISKARRRWARGRMQVECRRHSSRGRAGRLAGGFPRSTRRLRRGSPAQQRAAIWIYTMEP